MGFASLPILPQVARWPRESWSLLGKRTGRLGALVQRAAEHEAFIHSLARFGSQRSPFLVALRWHPLEGWRTTSAPVVHLFSLSAPGFTSLLARRLVSFPCGPAEHKVLYALSMNTSSFFFSYDCYLGSALSTVVSAMPWWGCSSALSMSQKQMVFTTACL